MGPSRRHPSFTWELVIRPHDGSPVVSPLCPESGRLYAEHRGRRLGGLAALDRQSRVSVLRGFHLHLNDDEEQLYLHTYIWIHPENDAVAVKHALLGEYKSIDASASGLRTAVGSPRSWPDVSHLRMVKNTLEPLSSLAAGGLVHRHDIVLRLRSVRRVFVLYDCPYVAFRDNNYFGPHRMSLLTATGDEEEQADGP
ncbi:hypothetical protein DL770_010434 [Monosporascus sp. CRB-9-2]|nr:hypothetical protein DL770_010434 [Monosporascus sp. CRB-9-2]